jgi:hypothetical protein
MDKSTLTNVARQRKIQIGLILVALMIATGSFGTGCGVPFGAKALNSSSSFGFNLDPGGIVVPPGVQLKFQCKDPTIRGAGESKLRRLTRSEFAQTLTDLVGNDVVSDASIQTQLGVLSADKIQISVSDISENVADSTAQALVSIATQVSDLVVDNATRKTKIFGACASQATVVDECIQSFIKDFGLRVYRRPVAPDEGATLLAQYKTSPGVEGLKRLLMRLMLAPSMLFHVESGASTVGERIRLTDFEVASRISYRVMGTMPDAALFEAAAKGQLQDLANVKAQTKRLFDSPLAKVRVIEFFRFYMQLDQVPQPYAGAVAAAGIDGAGLRDEMVQESVDFITEVIWKKRGTFKDLLLSKSVFPKSDRMAKILETTVVGSSGEAVQTSEKHAGIILRPSMFAGADQLTKPYHRASVLRRRILCETFGAPDPNAIAERQTALGDLSGLGNRERLSKLTTSPQCLGCHSLINPAGFVLEGYDQLGAVRMVESIFDPSGKVTATHPIDTQVSDAKISDVSGPVASFRDAVDLAKTIASGNTARSCFAETVYEYQRWRESTAADACAIREVESASTDNGTVLDAFEFSIANEDIFWKTKGS